MCDHVHSGCVELLTGLVVEIGVGDEEVDVPEFGEPVEVLLTGLGGVRDDDDPACCRRHGPLRAGLDLVGSRHAARDGEAIRPEEGDVDADVVEGVEDPLPTAAPVRVRHPPPST